MKRAIKTRRGFTLVELSIVLVIIGLIIGGVLTGQQIIQNARVTNALDSIQAYEAQFQTYVQNYGALPGDDANAITRFPEANIPGKGDGLGTLDGPFDSGDPLSETRLVWSDLRAAGLIKNQLSGTSNAIQPPNPFNGIYGFQTGAFNNTFTTIVLCMSSVPAAAAEAIDSRLDDGSSNTGNVQAMVSGAVGTALTGTAAPSYGGADTYTVCIKM